MAVVYTQNYDSETTGAEPSGFNKFGANNTYAVSETFAVSGAKSLKLNSSGAIHDGYWVSSGHTDGDIIVRSGMRGDDMVNSRLGVFGRAFNDAGTNKGYASIMRSSTSIRLAEIRGVVETTVATTAISALSNNTWYYSYLYMNGSSIKAGWNTTATTPSSWTIEVTNTSFTNAQIGIGHYAWLSAEDTGYADDLIAEDFAAGGVVQATGYMRTSTKFFGN